MKNTVIKVISILMALSLTMLCFVACGKEEEFEKTDISSTTTETTTEAPKATNINPFTGVADLSESAIGARPVAVMVENAPAARPQWGMSTPDVIIEGVVEGGITRMMWLYADVTKMPKVGPVRSARHDYVEIAQGMNAIYVHWGGSNLAYNKISEIGMKDIDGLKDGAYFKRDSSRSSRGTEHTGYTTGEYIAKAIANKKLTTKAKDTNWTMFKVVEDGVRIPFGGASGGAMEVNVTFSSSYKYSFKYSMDKNVYVSYLNGKAVTDGTDGKAVSFSNLIIMYSPTKTVDSEKHQDWDLSSGEALWISQGAGEKITWKKGGANSPLKFYGTDGKELIVNKGKTYVGVVPADQKSNFSIKES